MPALDGITIELDWGGALLDTAGNNILDLVGENVLDTGYGVCTDVLDVPIEIRRGQNYDGETERVPDTGTMKIVLNNSSGNSASTQGLYSTDHPNKHTGFGLGTTVRINLPYTTPYYKFQGRITRIEPEAGLLGNKRVVVEISDWVDIAARTFVPRLAVQQNKRDDEIMAVVLAAISNQPRETHFDVGDYTYPYALTDLQDEKVTLLGLMQRLALSGLGRFYIVGGTNSGEKLVYENNTAQTTAKAVALTLNNDFTNMKPHRAAYDRVRAVTATVTPMAVDPSPVQVFILPSALTIPANTSITFTAYFRDNTSGGRSRLSVINPVTPVANTDYKFSSVSGSGNDLNQYLTVSVAWGGNSAEVTVENIHPSISGSLWQFNLRAYGLYRNDPLGYTAVDNTIGEGYGQLLDLRMPYQSNYNVAHDVADALLAQLSAEATTIRGVEFVWNTDTTTFEDARVLECGDRVGLTDDVTGLTNIYTVIGYDLRIHSIGYIKQSLVLRLFREAIFATLDVTGLSELDGDDTILGY